MATKKKTDQETDQMIVNTELMTRRLYMEQLGQSYSGNRDLYQALGYPKTLTAQDYMLRYRRQDIAKRIIDAPVSGCWAKLPQVLETGEKQDTPFERAFLAIEKQVKLLGKLVRADKLCGLGRYSVLFFGYDGYQQPDLLRPVDRKKHQLLYITPLGEQSAEIVEWYDSADDPRYGQPRVYQLTMKINNAGATATRHVKVHASRCVHIAEGLLSGEVYGEPRLEVVYNRLMDLEKLVGGSGEMFWQGAFPGFAMKASPEFDITQSAAAITAEVDNYVHQLRRYMKLQGIDVQQLAPQAVDPRSHVDVQIDMISAAVGIPKRILLGSERGELASSQDKGNWDDILSQRRSDHCERQILRPVVDKLIDDGALPEPEDGYEVNWPPLYVRGDGEKAEVAARRAEALAKFIGGGLDQLMTFDAYLEHVCEYDRDVVDLIIKSGEGFDIEDEE